MTIAEGKLVQNTLPKVPQKGLVFANYHENVSSSYVIYYFL